MTKEELKKLVTTDADDLEKECINLPDYIVEVYTLFSEADNTFNMYNEAVNAAYATKYLEVRADFLSSGTKATESLVDNTVKADTDYCEMLDKKYRLKKERDFLYGLLQGLYTKRETVKTLSFLRREDRNY
jgi:hypothetical protein